VKAIGREKVTEFGKLHAIAPPRLHTWVKIVESAAWKTPLDVCEIFRTVDLVGKKTVFDIGGNKYRVIATISYTLGIVEIRRILTHADYDKGKWK
jgi:mRNA interferase HigB